ncbi:MAG: PAS domain-containing protein [Planctomycetota bacterium]
MNASHHAPDASVTAPSRRRFVAGPVVTLLTLAVTALLDRSGHRIDSPSPFWLVAVTFAAYQGGRRQGLLSAAVFTVYGAYYFRPPAGLGHYLEAHQNLERLLTLAVVAPAIALMVGVLKRRTVHLARREATLQSVQRVRELLHDVEAIVWEADAETWQFSFVSHGAEQILGYPSAQWLGERDFWVNILHPDDRSAAVALCRAAVREGRDNDFEYRAIARDGRVVWLRDIVRVVAAAGGRRKQLRGVMVDISAHKREESLKSARRRVLELIAAGGPLDGLLVELVRLVERHCSEALGAILLADATQHQLHWRAAPSLPRDFLQATPTIPIDPSAYCCGAAVARRARVIVTDIATDSAVESAELPSEFDCARAGRNPSSPRKATCSARSPPSIASRARHRSRRCSWSSRWRMRWASRSTASARKRPCRSRSRCCGPRANRPQTASWSSITTARS